MVAKKRNAAQEIEHTKSLAEQCKRLEVDDNFVMELNVISSWQGEEWGGIRERMR